jgi:hypothetical protein
MGRAWSLDSLANRKAGVGRDLTFVLRPKMTIASILPSKATVTVSAGSELVEHPYE